VANNLCQIKSSFGPNEHTTGQQKRFFQFRKSRGAEIETFRKRLSEYLDRDEKGHLKMTITLPGESVLDNLAKSLAQILGSGIEDHRK